MKKNIFFASLTALVLSVGLLGSIFLVQKQQQIGKRASTVGGVGKITLNPSSATKYVGQIFPVAINFKTGTGVSPQTISALTFRITYPYTGTIPELDIVDSSGSPVNQIMPDSALTSSGNWLFPIKSVARTGSLVVIEFSAINTNINGYASSTDSLLTTFYLKSNRVSTIPVVLTFDTTETKMMTKVEPIVDILDNPVNGSFVVQNDTVAPSAITNLSVSNPTFQSVVLTWTAPADSGPEGKANSYDLRYSTTTINDSNWGTAVRATGLSTPLAPGNNQTFTINGLTPGTQYYFAIKSIDASSNISALSNIATSTTLSATISFGFKLQGISSGAISKSFQVTLKDASPVTLTVPFVSNVSGVFFPQNQIQLTSYSIPVSGRTVDILVKDANHLAKKLGSITLTSGNNVGPVSWNSLQLLAGDFVAPVNTLTIDDISAMLTKYTALSVPADINNRIYDVNSDGFINVTDIALVLANFTALNVPGDN